MVRGSSWGLIGVRVIDTSERRDSRGISRSKMARVRGITGGHGLVNGDGEWELFLS